MIRYIVRHAETGAWMMTIYADRSRNETPGCTNYYAGDLLVASVDPRLVVVDSGGRMAA